MKLSEIGEFGLIKAIEAVAAQAGKGEGVVKGIGDDVAIIRSAPGKVLLVTTDLLLQDVHFTLAHTDPVALGKKALAANLSDIAACGGTPTAFVVSLALPGETAVDFVKALYEGMMEQARQFNCSLVGGDTSKGKALMISITLLGEAEEGKVVYRHGAKQGDRIFVTGQLGDSALGLEMLRNGVEKGHSVQRHLAPTPRIREGQEVAHQGLATAMIDISDGLVADLGHVLEASNVGAQVQLAQLPLSEEYRKHIGQYQSDPYYFALAGGEDYELLFTAPEGRAEAIKKLAKELGTPMTLIGEIIEASKGMEVLGEDGKEYSVEQQGHDHFKI
jgi:thiamine-monophosphate kinase